MRQRFHEPGGLPDIFPLSGAQLNSLDSSGQVIVDHNPGNPELQSLRDSTLLVLAAGVSVKRLDVTTDLTSAPLFFVGIHRAFNHAGGPSSFSTWTLVGFDDPSHLTSVVEVSGFKQTGGTSAPSSVTGTIGDGTGVVNALFLQVAAGGAVTEWHANAGSVTIASDSGSVGSPCPGFTPTPIVSCVMETMHVHFTATTPTGTGGASAKHATLSTDVDVPTMKLIYSL